MPEPPDRILYEDAERTLRRLDELLRDHGVAVSPTSQLAHLRSFFPELISAAGGGAPLASGPGVSARVRGALGWFDIAEKILSVSTHPDFEKLKVYFPLFSRSDRAIPVQNESVAREVWLPTKQARRDDGVASDVANKCWELHVACLVLGIAESISVEDPERPNKGPPNPDIMFTYQGRTWGIACKVPGAGASPESFRSLVRDGVRQIERSTADTGFVFCNLKNNIDHSQLLDLEANAAPFENGAAPLQRLAEACDAFERRIASDVPDMPHLFEGMKAAPLSVHYCFSACRILLEGRPRLTPVARIHPYAYGWCDIETRAMVDSLVTAHPRTRVIRTPA